MTKAIRLARDLGIRTIQLAGYDVYYEEHDEGTRQRFAEGLAWASKQFIARVIFGWLLFRTWAALVKLLYFAT